MKNTLFLLSSFLIMSTLSAQSISRDVVSTSGSTYSNTTATLSWTLGEPVSETFIGSSNIITQGYHQSKLWVTAMEENSNTIEVTVFPNPTDGKINLNFTGKHSDYSVALYDFEGRMIRKITVDATVSNKLIDLSEESAGTYLLKIHSGEEGKLNTYKIQKLNY